MVATIVSVVADRMIGLLEERATRYRLTLEDHTQEEVRCLAAELKTMKSVFDDAEDRRFYNQNINNWLLRLERTTNAVDAVLDEWAIAVRREQIQSSLKVRFTEFNLKKENITNIFLNVKAQLEEIWKERYIYLEISQPTFVPLPISRRPHSSPCFDTLAQVHGREEDVHILVNRLKMGSQEECGIQAIVGMGGIGKTTLAQLVYNHSRVVEYFDLRIWVCVSNPFDLTAITIGILESINKSFPNTDQLEDLLGKVRESIYGKRFILVLDDVWTEDHNKLEPLISLFRYGGVGSRVLVTTRNVRVAEMIGLRDSKIYRPGLLSDEDCWLLVCQVALSGGNEVKFEEIGKKIAKKCNGLPLVACFLGNLLYHEGTIEKWENVLLSEVWQMEEAKVELFPHFLFSYDELSPTLKLCFSYCVVFPKGTKIIVENLIENWISLGYLGSDVGDMELKGRECFNILAMQSLFHDFERDDMHEILSCKMHVTIHDFTQFLRKSGMVEETRMDNSITCPTCNPLLVSIVNKFSTLHCDDENPPALCKCFRRLKVLSLTNCVIQSIVRAELEQLNYLRCLNFTGITKVYHRYLRSIFNSHYLLQTLSLRKCGIEKIQREMGNLINLRRLDLSWNESLKELPKNVGKLVNLTHLNLSWAISLEELPREIENLVHLRHLNLKGNESLKEVPKEIGNLRSLTHLDLSRNESLKELPKEIGNLISLTHLDLSRNESLKELPKEIGNLRHMTHFDLSWNEYLKELPKEIWNLIHLRHLKLKGIKCLKELSSEIGKFINLRRLDLSWNKSLNKLPREIRNLIHLKHLKLKGNKSLEALPEGICDLQELQTLNILGCKKICRLPEGVAKLTGLRTLNEFRGGSGCNKFGLLKNLNNLDGVLWLRIKLDGDFDLAGVVEDAREAELEKKRGINEFQMYFEEEESSVHVDVAEALQPHQKLREVSIWNYGGSKLPIWMLSSQVRNLNLHFCKNLTSLPSLGKLPCLEELCIDLMEELNTVGREFLGITTGEVEGAGRDVIAFPKLKTLEFRDCGKWIEWEDITDEESGLAMPCLTELTITGCNGLTLLPHRLLRKASSLEKLRISGSKKLVCRYDNVDGSDWESISLNNPGLQLISYS